MRFLVAAQGCVCKLLSPRFFVVAVGHLFFSHPPSPFFFFYSPFKVLQCLPPPGFKLLFSVSYSSGIVLTQSMICYMILLVVEIVLYVQSHNYIVILNYNSIGGQIFPRENSSPNLNFIHSSFTPRALFLTIPFNATF